MSTRVGNENVTKWTLEQALERFRRVIFASEHVLMLVRAAKLRTASTVRMIVG